MTEDLIARINELYKKSKSPAGLTNAEKQEQQRLRRQYVEDFKKNLRGVLNNVDIKEPDGSITHVKDIPKATKQGIRIDILNKRKNMNINEHKRLSEIICEKVLEKLDEGDYENVCIYMPIHNEVDVTCLIDRLMEKNINIYCPVIKDNRMDFHLYESMEQLQIGMYGIREPKSEQILDCFDKTAIIMPGAVFTEKLDRIGYGGGYYDRYVDVHSECTTIAVAFSFQIVEEIPTESHDRKPSMLITETNIYC